jgi:2-polyprenyl-3-methyl-5-hydroxy-6-metoxy-1,4-benzoquinol methylase
MKEEIVTSEAIDEWAWFKCFFRSNQDNWDGKTYKRNYNELMLRDTAVFALGDLSNKKVLDIGCGWGLYAITFARMGAVVSGQDLSEDYIANAKQLMASIGLEGTFKVGNANKLLFEDNSFDAVFSGDFFEHITLEDKKAVIKEAYRVLKPGGVFTIKTPNLTYLRISLLVKRIAACLFLKNPFKMFIPHTRNNPDCQHHGLMTYPELEQIMEENMFHFQQVSLNPLIRKGLPLWLGKLLSKRKMFNEHILLTVRKPVFLGFWP